MTRRAVILPVVLFVLLLVGLLGGMFAFRVNADLASMRAVAYRLQTRLAAEAGIERAKLLLQADRWDMDRWYHNPEELHRIIVWAYDGDSTMWATNDERLDEGAMAYRFSLIADDPRDDEDFVRFGLTDESSKLNLNRANARQLLVLVRAAVGENQQVDPQEIVAAILDWRDRNRIPLGKDGDTEGEYYRMLDRPYHVKNADFDTVEELLLVKGITNEILFGEDFDRNGLLTPNEDDGDKSFPMDNQDGQLNRGLFPYLTVTSFENDVDSENRRRIYLPGEENSVREQLADVFEDEPEIIEYIVTVSRGQGAGGAAGGSSGTGQGTGSNTGTGTPPGGAGAGSTGSGDASDPDKSGTRQQRQPEDDEEAPDNTGEELGEGESVDPQGEEAGEPAAQDPETGGARNASGPMRTPVSLLLPRSVGGVLQEGPVGPEHLARLLDRTTFLPPGQPPVSGLINVNTAPRLVLRCIEGLTDDQVERIIETRDTIAPADKVTFAWLATEEVLDLVTLERIAPFITARGQQFTIESLGYADHIGMVTRLQVVVDMLGPIAQIIYYRDLSYLGSRYPIREEDLETLHGR
ncbi:MAG: general secretion pathway protein GspK [Planctomycetes bacterium]|nr:general secretion pathway protein GspK [Planctomycetota bacterium]